MAELERVRTRERSLEQALAKLAGENWQVRPFTPRSYSALTCVGVRNVGSCVDGVGYRSVFGDGPRPGDGVVVLASGDGDTAASF
jgi:hypothetical protein